MAASHEQPVTGERTGIAITVREGGTALVALVAIAVVARVIQLNSGLWADEIISLNRSFRLPGLGVFTTFIGDNHHPLYSVLARASIVSFGESAWALRLPAMIFGVAAVPATYAVARLVASRAEALVASLLLAVSYHHVWFSQNARGYTLIAFLALLSTLALVRMLEQGTWLMAFAYALCAALGAYTHLTMVFVAIAHALVAAGAVAWPERGRRRIDWHVAAGAFGLAAMITVLFYAPMLGQVTDFFLQGPSDLSGKSTPSWALREGIRVLVLGLGASGVIVATIVLAAGTIIGLAGFAAIFRTSRTMALAIALPPLMVGALALLGRGTMYPRFFFFAAGTAVIVFVRGVFAVAESLRLRWPAVPSRLLAQAFSGLVIAASAASLRYNYRYPKQDFAGAMQYVLATKAPDDVVGFTGVSDDPYPTAFGQDWPTLETVEELNALRARGRTWLIYTFPRYLEVSSPELAVIVKHECHERAVFPGTVGGGDMIICTLDPA